jgi:predicted TIM-barrel fold metal-dependent hydrolase
MARTYNVISCDGHLEIPPDPWTRHLPDEHKGRAPRHRMLPSEYARAHFRFGIVRDPLSVQMRSFLPVETLMWGSDFPHSVSSFPETEKWLSIIFDGVPEDVRRRVLVDNPCAFFGLDPEADLTVTPR